MTKDDIINFEKEVADRFEHGEIKGPIHISGGNEDQLIEIFKEIPKSSWIFSNWRSHYHALLHGVPPDKVMSEIVAGHSMHLMFPEHNFFTSAIVGGTCPIAVGVAKALKLQGSINKVWCFIGDMTASIGTAKDARSYATGHDLPIEFVIECNGFSTNTPTLECWGLGEESKDRHYRYTRTFPHCGIGRWVNF